MLSNYRLRTIGCLSVLMHALIFGQVQSPAQKEIVIIVPSYNNAEWYERNLESVCNQNYSNYRVIYIDDNSVDGTGQLVHDYIMQHNLNDRVTLVRNSKRWGPLFNIWNAVHSCNDDCIIAIVDGDDWLENNGVLVLLNEVYVTKDAWLTYGQYKEYPSEALGPSGRLPQRVIDENLFRKISWSSSHLRTFYAWLFKQISYDELMYGNKLFPMALDVAMMLPMLEMAGNHGVYIPNILYVYNNASPLNHHKINKQLQRYLARIIRIKPPRSALQKPVIPHREPAQNTLIIFSEDAPTQLQLLLESVHTHIRGLTAIKVIYKASSQEYALGYQRVIQEFAQVNFIAQKPSFQESLKVIYTELQGDYLLFATDNMVVVDDCNINECISALRKTYAYGFYLRLGANIVRTYPVTYDQPVSLLLPVGEGVFAWKFKNEEGEWAYPFNFEMTLYKKRDFQNIIMNESYASAQELLDVIGLSVELNQVGLCFEQSKVMKLLPKKGIVHNRVQLLTSEELVAPFNTGKKLDISGVQFDRTMVCNEFIPVFV